MRIFHRFVGRSTLLAVAGAMAVIAVASAQAGSSSKPILATTLNGKLGHFVPAGSVGRASPAPDGVDVKSKGPFVYYDEGEGSNDVIDVFKTSGTSLTKIQSVATTAGQAIAYFGSTTLAVVTSGTHNCLVLLDQQGGNSAAMLRSFPIHAGGLVGTEASAIPDPGGTSAGLPVDVHAYGSNAVIVESPYNTYGGIEIAPVNADCTLGTPSYTPNTDSEYLLNSSVSGAGILTASDLYGNGGSGSLDTWDVSGSTPTLMSETPSLNKYPDGMSTDGSNIAAGDASTATQAELWSSGPSTPNGSLTSSDPNDCNSASSVYDISTDDFIFGTQSAGLCGHTENLMIVADNAAAVTQVADSPTLDQTSWAGYLLTTDGSLWVDGENGNIDGCTTTQTGVSCTTTNPTGSPADVFSTGMACATLPAQQQPPLLAGCPPAETTTRVDTANRRVKVTVAGGSEWRVAASVSCGGFVKVVGVGAPGSSASARCGEPGNGGTHVGCTSAVGKTRCVSQKAITGKHDVLFCRADGQATPADRMGSVCTYGDPAPKK